MVLLGKWFQNRDAGESRDPNGLYGLQDVFGRARFPPNPIRPQFLDNFLVLGDLGQGPWALPIGPLWAYWALCGAYWAPCGASWHRKVERLYSLRFKLMECLIEASHLVRLVELVQIKVKLSLWDL